MLRKFIILSVIIVIPLAFYVASQYGQLEQLSFDEAVVRTVTEVEGDQSPKVIVVATIEQVGGTELTCTDHAGKRFTVNYTGTEPEQPFKPGQSVRFVGHVHGSGTYYFHATQVYAR